MHPQLLNDIVALCRRRIDAADSPGEQAASVESLEAALVQLADASRTNKCGETCERAQVCATCMQSLAAPAPQPEQPHETMDAIASSRYKVSRDGGSMLGPWAVRAGDGDQILYHGSKADCEAVARRLTGAFLDGGFVALKLRAPSVADETVALINECRAALAEELAAALGWPAGISAPPVWDDLLREAARLRVATPVATDTKWDGAEEWMPLAWELCAEENGEEACSELVWEGGPIKEPWGDRWLKYEDEAKRLIALVRKCVPALTAPQAPQQAELTDEQLDALAMDDDGLPNSHLEFARAVIAADRAIRSPGMAPRKPLTAEQVKAVCIDTGYWSCNEGSRAHFINGLRHGEIAHGIGVESHQQVTGSQP